MTGDGVADDPTTTLAAHLEIVGNEPPVRCSCGWVTDLIGGKAKHAHAAHIMAMLAEEGWAFVKLPEAEEDVSTPTFDAGCGAVTHADDGEVRLHSLTYRSGSLGGVFRSPAKATELAAALLAAARATDGV